MSASTAETNPWTTTVAMAEAPFAVPGFELRHEVGRGGMGVVYRARDVALDREVAVKLLQAKYDPDSSVARRFVEEARITAQLQHPGIPPVYMVGALSGGRPYLAMKLIRGETLDVLLKNPGAVDVLAVFEGIAQAIGYAHAHHVIHRDLKPSNVMVGAFGEVQAMDWGLAKLLTSATASTPEDTDPEATRDGSTQIRSPRDSDGSFTQAGSVLGTPSCMAPEQAAGELDKVDRRSDVFGLGAILCWMLTGKPVFEGRSAESVRLNAVRGKTEDAFARLAACQAEPEVVALCKRCLAFDPAERPADANAVAELVSALRRQAADRARNAELDKAKADVQLAEQAKRRKVWYGLAATLALGLAVSAGLALWANAARQRAEAAETSADTRRREAVAATNLADQRFVVALDAIKSLIFEVQSKLANKPGMKPLREALLKEARAKLEKLTKESDQGAAGHSSFGIHASLGELALSIDALPKRAKAEYEKAHRIADRMAKADPSDAQAQRDLLVSFNQLGDVALQQGDAAAARRSYEQSLEVRQRLAKADPSAAQAQRDLSVSFNKLGTVARQQGDAAAARRFYEQSLEVSQRLAKADPSDAQTQRNLSISFNGLGGVALQQGDAAAARWSYEQSLEVSQRLAKADPSDAQAQRELSISFSKLGDVALQQRDAAAAQRSYEQSLEVSQRLAKADPSDARAQRELLVSFSNLGDVALQQGGAAAARRSYEQGLEVSQRLAKADPSDAQAQRDLSVSFEKLGGVALRQGDAAAARRSYEQCQQVRQRLAKADPSDARAQRDLSVSFNLLGDVALWQRDAVAARRSYEQGLEVSQRLAKADPSDAQAQHGLLGSHSKLGALETAGDDFDAAAKHYRAAMDAVRKHPKQEFFANDLRKLQRWSSEVEAMAKVMADPNAALALGDAAAVALMKRQAICRRRGDVAGMRATVVVFENLARKPPANPGLAYDAACVRSLLAGMLKDKPVEAQADADQAMAWLAKAVAAGYNNRAHMEKDADLDVLRGREDFKKLLAALPAPAQSAPVKPAAKK